MLTMVTLIIHHSLIYVINYYNLFNYLSHGCHFNAKFVKSMRSDVKLIYIWNDLRKWCKNDQAG